MDIKFVFEDCEETPSSILLKSSYCGDNIYFSNGASGVFNKAVNIKKDGDKVYIFYDVSPNNPTTVQGYKCLIEKLADEDYDDIYVVPIVCIEYYLSKFLDGINALRDDGLVQNIVREFNWESVPDKWKKDGYVGGSLEHAYKKVISTFSGRCTSNSFKYTDKTNTIRKPGAISGIFYEKDCNCERKFCRINCEMCLKEKAERLYTMLPAYNIVSDEHREYLSKLGILSSSINNKDLKAKMQRLYNTICDSLGCDKIKIRL